MNNEIEKTLVENFLRLDAESKRLAALAEQAKKDRDDAEAELLDLLDDEGKKKSATFKGLGHVTCMPPRVSQAYAVDEEALFAYLRSPEVDRADLIKTAVHHSALAAFISQMIKATNTVPPGVGYILKQSLRAYPEK